MHSSLHLRISDSNQPDPSQTSLLGLVLVYFLNLWFSIWNGFASQGTFGNVYRQRWDGRRVEGERGRRGRVVCGYTTGI